MRAITAITAVMVGVISGLCLTWFASTGTIRFGIIKVGAWIAWPKSGTVNADPYSRALHARAGELPLGSTDGISFIATSDDAGYPLNGRCDIHISGRLPAARFWTLTVYDPQGRLIENAGGRHGFTSAEILRTPDADARANIDARANAGTNAGADIEILLAPRARSGNWIPTGGRERVSAVLRFYDAPLELGARSAETMEMPSVWQEFCP